MTAPTSPSAVPADVRELAHRIVLHCQHTAVPEATEIVGKLLMADRANRPSLTEDERNEETLDRVASAIEAADCPGREGPYGLYDYGTGISHPVRKRHCVRDFRDLRSPSYGGFVLCTDDREEAEALLRTLTRQHIASAAIRVLADRSEPRQEKEGDCG